MLPRGGGLLGLKTDGGVPLATENWTQKDQGKNWIWGQKDWFLIFVKIGSFCTPKDSFAVGGWEKVPQKDRVQSSGCQKRGSKRLHIHITQHRGSTLPGICSWSVFPYVQVTLAFQEISLTLEQLGEREGYSVVGRIYIFPIFFTKNRGRNTAFPNFFFSNIRVQTIQISRYLK